MTSESDYDFNDEQILFMGARKLWPNTARVEQHGAPTFVYPSSDVMVITYLVITDDGNRVATCWIDPEDFMPVYKPTGSTPPREVRW